MKNNKIIYLATILLNTATLHSAANIGHELKKNNGEMGLQLIEASKYGNIDEVKRLIEAGVNVNAALSDGTTALMIAVINEHQAIISQLLSAGADVNVTDQNGQTALILAVFHKHKEIIPQLLSAGADVNAANVVGFTPLILAGMHGQKDIMSILLSAGADLDIKDEQGRKAIDFVLRINPWDSEETQKNKPEMVKLLENEPKIRDALIKKRIKNLVNIVNEIDKLLPVLSPIIGEYSVSKIEDIPESERK